MVAIYSSSRILIRQFSASEEQLFCRFFDDEDVMRYLPAYSTAEFQHVFQKALQDYKTGPFGRWGIWDQESGRYVGNCLLRELAEDNSFLEIGYSIAKEYWGRGIGSELANAVVDYAFSNTATTKLAALTDPANIGSQRVLEKVGFHRDGNIERHGANLYFFSRER